MRSFVQMCLTLPAGQRVGVSRYAETPMQAHVQHGG